ncbi:MAG: hypothetical protein NPINA01_22430 [Nitrospinaceae bacterium]|nr:MAG: hypothetical protein NPINA01_22430 [Nitrospinaceae bacterium]
MGIKKENPFRQVILPSLLLGLAYFLAGRLGTFLAMLPGYVTAVFPASGIAMAAILWRGTHLWPGILLGSFCLNLSLSYKNMPDFSIIRLIPLEIMIGLGSSGGILLGAFLYHRYTGSGNPLEKVRNILVFISCSAVVSSAVSATVGATSLCLKGAESWDHYFDSWLTWWLGDAMGVLVITPLILVFIARFHSGGKPMLTGESVTLVFLLFIVSEMVFGTWFGSGFHPLVFMLFPLLAWAALRFGHLGAVTAVFFVSIYSVLSTAQGSGPFVKNFSLNDSLLLLQAFLGVAASMTLILSATLAEGERARKDLLQAHDELEDKVQERTAELQETNHLLHIEIDDKKRIEKNFQDSEERLNLALEATAEGVWDWNVETGHATYSPQWFKLLGYEPDELPHHVSTWENLVHPDDMPKLMEVLNVHFAGKTPIYEFENRLLTKSGKWCWTLDRGKVVARDDEGKPLRMVGTNSDITERKMAEMEINHRTQELERSNKDLEEFAYIAAHDLQEPLRKIIIFGDLFKNKFSGTFGETYVYLEKMQASALRMRRLVGDLLEFSKIKTRETRLVSTDLNQVLVEVVDSLEGQINAVQGRVDCDSLPTLVADPSQMNNLFQNLVSNALKYHRDGVSPVVQIKSSFDENSGEWKITVEDNGIGFDEKYARRIFKPFQRLHEKTTFEGTGIGLAICENIISRHGGNINVTSEAGKGSKFSITLPEKQSDKFNGLKSFAKPQVLG